MDYKYLDPEGYSRGFPVTWLKVIKKLHWTNRPSDIRAKIPVGAITWMIGRFDAETSVHPEDNRYCCNFDGSCFELTVDPRWVIPVNTKGLLVQSHNISEYITPKKSYISSCNLKIV